MRYGPNVPLEFEGFNVISQYKGVRVDAFFVQPVSTGKAMFDNKRIKDSKLWGLYIIIPKKTHASFDLYYLGLKERNAVFIQGTANQVRHSFGTRIWKLAKTGFAYNLEGVYQFGKFGNSKVSAYYASAEMSYGLSKTGWQPLLTLSANLISGDKNRLDRKMQTFDALFPKPYFGLAAPIGPANLIDVHPGLKVRPSPKWVLGIETDFLWRNSSNDRLYAPPVFPSRPPFQHSDPSILSSKKFIGVQYIFESEWQLNQHLNLYTTYAYFPAGGFIKETSKAKTLGLWLIAFTYKF